MYTHRVLELLISVLRFYLEEVVRKVFRTDRRRNLEERHHAVLHRGKLSEQCSHRDQDYCRSEVRGKKPKGIV